MSRPPPTRNDVSSVEGGPRDDGSILGTPPSKDLEVLGRQRPPSLSTALAECGFVFTIVFSMCMAEYYISGFNIILPAITQSLHIPESARTWPAAVTNLATGCLLLPCARFCDQYGGKVVFLAGHTWLLVWSLVCGFAKNSTMLTVCRAMQVRRTKKSTSPAALVRSKGQCANGDSKHRDSAPRPSSRPALRSWAECTDPGRARILSSGFTARARAAGSI